MINQESENPMQEATTLTEEILTSAQDITSRVIQNAGSNTVLEVGLILAIAQLIVAIDNSTGRLVQAMY
jgi:hypothetical protein